MEYVFGFIIFVAFMGVYSFFSEIYQSSKEKEQYDLEQKKKADEIANEAQRKQYEYEFELKKKAGLDPAYQDLQLRLNKSQRKIQRYKTTGIIVICIISICGLAYAFFKDSGETKSNFDYESSSAENLNEEYTETDYSENTESIVVHSKDVLPNRYVPTEENKPVTQVQQSDYLDLESKTEANLETSAVKTQNENYRVSTTQISVAEAGSFIGQEATVCGTVSQVSVTSKATYINFGGYYPKQAFSAVIWSTHRSVPSENQNVCISGLIESYKGIPQIVIQSINHQISMQ